MRGSRLCLLLAGLAAYLPAAEYSHRTWRTEDGLPHNRVQALAQTGDGYLWVGTAEGLARFDGLRFHVFDRSNTPALRDNSISSLDRSADDTLWIGTEGGGLVRYRNGVFTALGMHEGLTNGFVRATHVDTSGTLWVGTDRGLFRWSGSDPAGRFIRLDNTPELPLISVVALAESPQNFMWVAASAGVMAVRDGLPRKVSCGQQPGVSAAIATSLIAQHVAAGACAAPVLALPSAPIASILRDSGGVLWTGTLGKGLFAAPPGGGATAQFGAPGTLPDNTVPLLFEDRQHNIWVGTQDGLTRLSRAAVMNVAQPQGLSDDNVSTVYEDRHRRLWIVSFSGEVYRWNELRAERYEPAALRNLRVRTVFEDSRGDLWFGTSGGGAVRTGPSGSRRFTTADGLRSDSVRQIYEDRRGALWFATSSGLSRLDGGVFTGYYLEQGLTYPSVRAIAEDERGDLLAATDAGLNRIHNFVIVPDALFKTLAEEKIWALMVRGDSIWLGTRGGGLVLIRQGRTVRFTAREGLPGNSVYQIVDDDAGRLWLSGPTGISAVSLAELRAIEQGGSERLHALAYGTSEGMVSAQMYGGLQPAGVRRASGEIWFAGVRGAIRLDPASLSEQRWAGPSPKALIESVTAGETPLPVRGDLRIEPRQSPLRLDFTACDLSSPQRVNLRYMLEGFDRQWIAATPQRSVTYAALPAGHYRFRVIGEEAGGRGVASEASVALYRAPSFYQTNWFYALLTIAAGAALWAGLAFYGRQTHARFALLLNERTRLAREMHDTVIQGCVGVSTLLEATARFQKTDLAEASGLLGHARSQIKATLEEARQAVWDLRHSGTEQSFLLNLLDLARTMGDDYGIAVESRVEGERIPLDPAVERTLLLVGREALRNAVAHAQASRIFIRVCFESSRVRLEVADNGAGFECARSDFEAGGHFGITGMRERVAQIGGLFELASTPGKGTAVKVSVEPRRVRGGAETPLQKTTIPR